MKSIFVIQKDEYSERYIESAWPTREAAEAELRSQGFTEHPKHGWRKSTGNHSAMFCDGDDLIYWVADIDEIPWEQPHAYDGSPA